MLLQLLGLQTHLRKDAVTSSMLTCKESFNDGADCNVQQ